MNLYLMVFLESCIVAIIMETLKKAVMKDGKIVLKEKIFLWILAFLLSVAINALCYFAFDFVKNGANFLSIFFYSMITYFIQKDLNLELVKPIFKKFMSRM